MKNMQNELNKADKLPQNKKFILNPYSDLIKFLLLNFSNTNLKYTCSVKKRRSKNVTIFIDSDLIRQTKFFYTDYKILFNKNENFPKLIINNKNLFRIYSILNLIIRPLYCN